MINPFEGFYDTEIEVYDAAENEYEQNGEKTLLGTIICDIQPCGGDTENKIYGLSESKEYKLFCDKNDLLKSGGYINFGGKWYMIVNTEERSFGMTAAVRSV